MIHFRYGEELIFIEVSLYIHLKELFLNRNGDMQENKTKTNKKQKTKQKKNQKKKKQKKQQQQKKRTKKK